ncbi:mitochondrial inner membrane protease subunit 1-like isoform X2 [Diospyros lotus]|uniref:mitochondrial inner membrane protease subunit 1-like isoform X2 n=1 Tax=Diospyros lotus TaxID=55363 RepID=UPI0022547017|nr:mitochondrial inner membrane protease subunit 1-like isoform X2 [Diospyros lotus]
MGVKNLQAWMIIVKEGLDVTLMVAKFFCALHVTRTYIFTPALTPGPSMLPTFSSTSDLVLVDRISARTGKVGTGDVVLVRSPENPRKVITKRVKAMEGDSVTYLVDPSNSDRRQTLVVPKGHVWIEGDNIYESHDSRHFGAVPYGLIQGRVFWRITSFAYRYGQQKVLDQLEGRQCEEILLHEESLKGASMESH